MSVSEINIGKRNDCVKRRCYFISVCDWRYGITRPGIAFAVQKLSRFSLNPDESHWNALDRLYIYLHETIGYSITYQTLQEKSAEIVGFSDADYAMNLDDRKSTSGFIFLLNGGPISWKAQLQKCVTLSSCEAEIVAITTASKELIWLQDIMTSLPLILRLPCHTLYTDNKAATQISENSSNYQRMKHVDTQYFKIREWISQEKLVLQHIAGGNMCADFLTKPLGFINLRKNLERINLKSINYGGVLKDSVSTPN